MNLRQSTLVRALEVLFFSASLSVSVFAPAARSEQTAAPASATKGTREMFVYVGTYTQGNDSRGIYIFRLNLDSGELSPAGERDGCENPTFLAIHPTFKYLYAVDEVGKFQGKAGGAVTAFSVDRKTGALTLLNHESSVGNGPCHITVDPRGKNALVANYGGGSVAVLPINADGRLAPHSCFIQHKGSSVNPQRQEGPHAHSINLDAAAQFAMVADLGLDKVVIYRFDCDKGRLTANDPPSVELPPGSGPRHFAFHPNGKFAYVINEMASTVTVFAYDPKRGSLRALQSAGTLPDGFDGSSTTAEVRVHPSGRFLYGSNRGHDSIAIFSIDETTGEITPVGIESTRGKTPRNFALDPDGRYLLAENQGSNTIVVFRIDPATGKLSATDQVVEVPSPVCIRMIPAAE